MMVSGNLTVLGIARKIFIVALKYFICARIEDTWDLVDFVPNDRDARRYGVAGRCTTLLRINRRRVNSRRFLSRKWHGKRIRNGSKARNVLKTGKCCRQILQLIRQKAATPPLLDGALDHAHRDKTCLNDACALRFSDCDLRENVLLSWSNLLSCLKEALSK